MSRRLLKSTMLAVPSPEYIARHGLPTHPDELADHACLRGFLEGARPATKWPLRNGESIEVDGPFAPNDMLALRNAARNGIGIALLPNPLVADDLNAKTLIPVLEEHVGMSVSLSLVWVERELLEPKVRAFVDLAVKTISIA